MDFPPCSVSASRLACCPQSALMITSSMSSTLYAMHDLLFALLFTRPITIMHLLLPRHLRPFTPLLRSPIHCRQLLPETSPSSLFSIHIFPPRIKISSNSKMYHHHHDFVLFISLHLFYYASHDDDERPIWPEHPRSSSPHLFIEPPSIHRTTHLPAHRTGLPDLEMILSIYHYHIFSSITYLSLSCRWCRVFLPLVPPCRWRVIVGILGCWEIWKC